MTYDDAPAGRDDGEPAEPAAAKCFAVLPPRVAVEDMVEEQPASSPGADTTPDANTEIAWRYGLSGGA